MINLMLNHTTKKTSVLFPHCMLSGCFVLMCCINTKQPHILQTTFPRQFVKYMKCVKLLNS